MNPEIVAHHRPAQTAILLMNLGTPTAPSAGAVRRYLRQFLSDARVVDLPRPIWALILHCFILPFRPRKVAHAYAAVWTPQGSPLLAISLRQRDALRARLAQRLSGVAVELAMTYGEPSVDTVLSRLSHERLERLLVIPLYPQYSATTTAAAFDAVWRVLGRLRRVPAVRTIDCYHDDPAYIEALADSVRGHWQAQGRGDYLLMSFHSIPQACLEKGDPYFCHCEKTGRLVAEALGLGTGDWSISYQSRIGNQPWLQPYTDIVIPQLAQRGVRKLDVICPGFAADCLETLEEVALRYAEDFRRAGGETLRYIPALNECDAHIDLLERLVRRELHDWVQHARTDTPAPARVDGARQRLACPGLSAPQD